MARYRLSGFVIQSNVALPELPAARGTPSHVLELDAAGPTIPDPCWFHHWQEARKRRWLSFARMPNGYLLRFPSLADFEITREGSRGALSRIRARPRRGVPAETIRHLFLDQVWPLVLSGGGRSVIHASAVVLPDGRAVAFAGPAGAGKSSLAASMALADAAWSPTIVCFREVRKTLEGHAELPGPAVVARHARAVRVRRRRIDVAHYTSKKRLADALRSRVAPHRWRDVCRWSARARARVAIAPLSGAAALMDLVPFTYLLDYRARDHLEGSFRAAGGTDDSRPRPEARRAARTRASRSHRPVDASLVRH
jgi:hypothetical protein